MDFRDTPRRPRSAPSCGRGWHDSRGLGAARRRAAAGDFEAHAPGRPPVRGRLRRADLAEGVRRAGLSPTYQAIYLEEMSRVDAPGPPRRHRPQHGRADDHRVGHRPSRSSATSPLLSGEEIWCQGFSEPGSGSDLAAVRTRAVLDGDDSWSTARRSGPPTRTWPTAASSCPHRPEARQARAGCRTCWSTCTRPASTVRPLQQITGDPEFNEIFFDRRTGAARVDPRRARRRLEGRDDHAAARARHARVRAHRAAGAHVPAGWSTHRAARPPARRRPADPRRASPICTSTCSRLRFTNYRVADDAAEDRHARPGGLGREAAWSEANQRLTYARPVGCSAARPARPATAASWNGFWQYRQLRSRGNTIEAGTSEILRNIIAERVLGLPHRD